MALGLRAQLRLAAGDLAGANADALTVLGASPLRGLASVCIGLFLGLVGTDLLTGQQRFNFGIPQLADGIDEQYDRQRDPSVVPPMQFNGKDGFEPIGIPSEGQFRDLMEDVANVRSGKSTASTAADDAVNEG